MAEVISVVRNMKVGASTGAFVIGHSFSLKLSNTIHKSRCVVRAYQTFPDLGWCEMSSELCFRTPAVILHLLGKHSRGISVG